jgi:hypothetical protein
MTSSHCWDCIDEIKKDSDSICGFMLTLYHKVNKELDERVETESIAGPFPDEWAIDMNRLTRARGLLADMIKGCDKLDKETVYQTEGEIR